MSWYMMCDVFVKKNGIWKNTEVKAKELCFLKSLCDVRGELNDNIYLRKELSLDEIKALNALRTEKYFEGKFYDRVAFSSVLKEYKENLYELLEKKSDWKNLQKDISYLKLSSEEKENIFREYEYLDDMIEEEESRVSALLKVLGIFDTFEDYDQDTIIFVYCDD